MKSKIYITIIFMFCFSLFAFGQNTEKKSGKKLTISGTILTIDKKPVEGAVLYIDGVKTGYKTKNDGSYKIKVSPSAGKLIARSTEFGYGEADINGLTSINVTLNGIPDKQVSESTDSSKQSGVTDSEKKAAKPRAKKMNTYTDIYQMIRAEVSGVVVSGRSIQIQQGHSFFGSGEPLYVVNGHIVNNIDFVIPLEVKSITVLKGSSAAIYGTRGSNGVINITLKNGTEKEK
jgi:TonB-dependent SusC/RagA subfamily outer membrane receptor